MTARVLSWDWRQQPDIGQLAAAVHDLSNGQVHLNMADTGSDDYALIVSDQPLTDAEARHIWEESL